MLTAITPTTFDASIFEVVNHKVNLTKMCQKFGKEVRMWTRLKQTQEFLVALQDSNPDVQIMYTRTGDNNSVEQGTFGTREVALKVAQWISPEFEVFCIQTLDKLLNKHQLTLPNFNNPAEAARAWADQYEHTQLLQKEVNLLATRDLNIEKVKDFKTAILIQKHDIGRSINAFVFKAYPELTYTQAHLQARQSYYQATGTKYLGAQKASLDEKKAYLSWLQTTKF
jgi:hypothetical protein